MICSLFAFWVELLQNVAASFGKHTDIVNSHGPPAPTLSDLQRYIWKEAISMPGMKTPF